MILELNRYRNNIDFIKQIYVMQIKYKDFDYVISELAVVTGVPIVAVAYFIGESFGFTTELNEMIDSLTKFYAYERVV